MWDKRAINAKLDEISGFASADKEDAFAEWERSKGQRLSSSHGTDVA
jgi:hypothetical protein